MKKHQLMDILVELPEANGSFSWEKTDKKRRFF